MSHGSRLLSCREIIARITDINGDSGNIKGDGYYNGLIQRALKQLSYSTLFDKRTFTAPCTAPSPIPLPPDLANIDSVHLFNGADCNMSIAVNVYHKPHFRSGKGDYVAENHGYNDGIVEGSYPHPEGMGPHFWDVQQGSLMLSSSCASYESVFVGYRGLGTVFGEEPLVPMVLEEAVVYWAALRSLEGRIHDTSSDKQLMAMAIRNCKDVLYGSERVWDTAKENVKMPDIKAMKDHNIYKGSYGRPF